MKEIGKKVKRKGELGEKRGICVKKKNESVKEISERKVKRKGEMGNVRG